MRIAERSAAQPTPEQVIAALSEPDFYPDHVERVEVHETHISHVFLAGEHAYKLKKPLVLPFLDYGTPERRRLMCEEEVRLNRRLASETYLGVRSIAARAGRLRLARESEPAAVDFVVEMRRYDPANTLAGRLECLAPAALAGRIDELALALARFHASAPVVASGTPAWLSVRRRLGENFQELLAAVPERSDTARVLALERFANAFIAARADTLEERATRGLVVEGHGDLRCEHVLFEGGVQVLDCIEFDRRMRELDVADELAFLAMDLARRGAGELAARLRDSYRGAGGDPGAPELTAFYACFRALVRCKVALVRASQQPTHAHEHGYVADARAHLALAEHFAWRARLPLVLVICGLPASGKSSLSSALSTLSGLPRMSSDVVRKRATGVAPDERAPQAAYGAAENARTYTTLGERAGNEARKHGGAVIDATFRHRADRARFREAFAGSAPLVFVECRAPLDVLLDRAGQRDAAGGAESDACAAIVLSEHGSWEPLDEVRPEAHLVLRSDRPIEHQLGDLQDMLDRRMR